jgi:hypothetical protein
LLETQKSINVREAKGLLPSVLEAGVARGLNVGHQEAFENPLEPAGKARL